MAIVYSVYLARRVIQHTLGHVAHDAQFRQLAPHRAPQIVDRPAAGARRLVPRALRLVEVGLLKPARAKSSQ